MGRTILHCDCNSFFASVEAAFNPELDKYAFAVCGDPEFRHGIVLAKNERAKKCGVKTGEAIWQAKNKCPSLLIVKPTYGMYDEFSERIFNIYCRYTDLVEPFGIDECWLDVTGTLHLFGTGEKIADDLRKTVREETGVTISVGVSFNKVFAKMGSDYKKPDATTVISEDNYRNILFPLPVSEFLFVGRSTLKRLNETGIFTIGDLAAADQRALGLMFGKSGESLYLNANGMDSSCVKPSAYKHEYKSIGNGLTFKRDLTSETELRTGIFMLCDKVASRLRKHGVECGAVQLSIKDAQLNSVQRQKILLEPTQLSCELIKAVYEMVNENWDIKENPVRALTVTGQKLRSEYSCNEQISFFDLGGFIIKDKQERIERTKDDIRRKYGTRALTMCSLIDNDLGL